VEHQERPDARQRVLGAALSRRNFVKRAAALGLSIPAVGTLLAACGGSSDKATATKGATTGGAPTPTSAITVNQNATATTASATGGSPVAPEATATSAPVGKAGGSINVLRSTDSDKLDPVVTDANRDIWIFMSIYDQLVKADDKGTGLKPGLAEKWSVSADGLSYTFNIRQGVKFSDGSAMTMDDITWSLTRAQTTDTSPWLFSLAQLKEAKAADDHTLVLTLTETWAPFLSDMSLFNASVVSKAFADKVGVDKLVDQTMGTGPYMLKEWKKSEYILLAKNPNYYVQGLPLLDEIKITEVPDTNSQVLQMQGGDVDGLVGQGDVPLNRLAELKADTKLQVQEWTSTYNNFVVFNTLTPSLSDVHARRALNYATDTLALIKTIRFGNGEFSNSFMPKGALYWNPDQTGYPFDLDKAKAEIAQSATPNGFSVKMMFSSGNAQAQAIATAIKDMWSKINVELVLDPLDSQVVTTNYRADKFETYQTGWTNDIIDPDELVSYAILPESTKNYHTNWTNQEAIDKANAARKELDPDKRRQLYYDIQKIHMDDAPMIYLYVVPYIDVFSTRIKGFFHHPMGQYVWENTYIDEG
jgi:peptide/nickel transport system substrate-binding protein